jgi:hypothetical protein
MSMTKSTPTTVKSFQHQISKGHLMRVIVTNAVATTENLMLHMHFPVSHHIFCCSI